MCFTSQNECIYDRSWDFDAQKKKKWTQTFLTLFGSLSLITEFKHYTRDDDKEKFYFQASTLFKDVLSIHIKRIKEQVI